MQATWCIQLHDYGRGQTLELRYRIIALEALLLSFEAHGLMAMEFSSLFNFSLIIIT